MLRIAFGNFEQQHPFALREHPVPSVDADGRLDGIGADFDQQGIQRDDLLPRHALRLSVVGDTAEQHAAARIGERGDLVRPVVPARADRTVSGEYDLLELPGAVLARPELAEDVLGAVTHRRSPKPGRFRFAARSSSLRSRLLPFATRLADHPVVRQIVGGVDAGPRSGRRTSRCRP